jgi:hypothetical protein
MDLYWFMPALVKRSVGSESGTTEEEGTGGGLVTILAQGIGIEWEKCTKGVTALLEVVEKLLSAAC